MATTLASTFRQARRAALLAAVLAVTAPAAAEATTYGWPLVPFDKQHPVRGFFGDPRIGHSHAGASATFHFDIGSPAADGTAVYTTSNGRIVVERERPETVSIIRSDGSVFPCWHVVPAVR